MQTVRVTSMSAMVAVLTALGFACVGSGGCSSLQRLFGIGPERASAEALAGRYRLEQTWRTSDSCVMEGADGRSDGSRVRGWIRLERIPASSATSSATPGSGGDADANASAAKLRLAMCVGGEACESPRWRMTLAASETGAWEAVRGSAMPEPSAAPARGCRLSSERFRVAPADTGIRLWRIRRGELVPLEGETSCEAETAIDYEEQLECLESVAYGAVRRSS